MKLLPKSTVFCQRCGCGLWHRARGSLCRRCILALRSEEKAASSPLCQHCHTRGQSKARKLCSACYADLAIRNAYPRVDDRFGVNSGANVPPNAAPPLPAEPTQANPGSEEKIAVLEARYARGEAIFHPDDLTAREWWQSLYTRQYHGSGVPKRSIPGGESYTRRTASSKIATAA